jgi:CDGSH-type Zn-finger protein
MNSAPADQARDRGSQPTASRAVVRVYPDGPLLVRGEFSIIDEHGREIEVKRKTVSLCRCGRTGLAPLCDGSHARRSGATKLSTRPDA